MINIDVEEIKLDEKTITSAKVYKNVLNNTAVRARDDLNVQARKTYAIKSRDFKKDMNIKRATTTRLFAVINSKGDALPLSNYKFLKNTNDTAARAKVYLKNNLKKLEVKDSNGKTIKAFVQKVNKDKHTHIGVFRRLTEEERSKQQIRYDEEGKGKKSKRNAIKQLYSLSMPQMIGNEREVYRKVEPQIKEYLFKSVQNELDKILQKAVK